MNRIASQTLNQPLKKEEHHNRYTDFTELKIQEVWEKATAVPNFDPEVYRKDPFGAWIKRSEYGNTSLHVSLGWIIEEGNYLCFDSQEGDTRLMPIQWENSTVKKGNHDNQQYVTAWGIKNVLKSWEK